MATLTAAHLAEATGGDPSSARRWLRGTRAPSGVHAVRALELTSLVERLAQVMQAAYIPIWLIKPIERLDDRRPIDVIRAGDYRSVSRLVASLEGMPVSYVLSLDVDTGNVHGVFVRHIPDGGDPLYEPVSQLTAAGSTAPPSRRGIIPDAGEQLPEAEGALVDEPARRHG